MPWMMMWAGGFPPYVASAGVLITPFHNMALMSPVTTQADVDRHTEVFAEAVGDLLGQG
jgi:glutamate-1-semialdehyde 2,1-aminomutase